MNTVIYTKRYRQGMNWAIGFDTLKTPFLLLHFACIVTGTLIGSFCLVWIATNWLANADSMHVLLQSSWFDASWTVKFWTLVTLYGCITCLCTIMFAKRSTGELRRHE